jgi:hypothetical protein
MTFHLTHITTTGKKKGKQKFRNAAAAATARQLKEDWKNLKSKHGVFHTEKKETMKPLTYNPTFRGQNDKIKSVGDGVGVATAKESKVYTGTKMIGIGQLHKSNAVPVFSSEDIIDIARMRR